MKLVLLFAASFSTLFAAAQPKVVTQAIITTSTNIIAPDDDEDVSQIQPQGGGFNFRTMLDGETKSTTYVKDDLVKTEYKSEVLKGAMYRDNTKKITTTITESFGNKTGFYTSDDDEVEMKKRMDSAREARMKTDTSADKPKMRTLDPAITVVYVDESKKIAGYNCKKAMLVVDRFVRKDTTVVWYNPEIKFNNVSSTGGTSGFGMFANMMGGGTVSFDKVDGFVMQYERKMPRGRVMEVKVTKIVTDKEIAANEFTPPKDVEIKSMKEMTQGGGFRMMMGGGRPQ